ncbi:MAG: phosphate uptake regulator PhoU, partial [Candidatus Lokiarchaeota archaeon]|nr:phosphate uptake regulator PhoU [Candidatus Lokiarchaeota archaeon]
IIYIDHPYNIYHPTLIIMGYHIETRKVQQTGGSSFIVSLPKEWIRKYGVKKNDILSIISQPDGNLLVSPRIESRTIAKIKKIDLDDISSSNFLYRLLIGAYIRGFSEIVLSSSRKIDSSIRNVILNFTQIVIGPEIINETNNEIVLKDLLNPKEMPFEKTIRRMYILSETMHEEAIKALKTRNTQLAEDILKRDNDIDRLHWLIGRQSNMVLTDIILAQKMGVNPDEANFFHLISRLLERIADHAVYIAQNVLILLENSLSEIIIESISNASELSMNMLINSLDAWLRKDITRANDNIDLVSELRNACEKVTIGPEINHLEQSIALGYIVESIRRTGEYSADICELIIDYLIEY